MEGLAVWVIHGRRLAAAYISDRDAAGRSIYPLLWAYSSPPLIHSKRSRPSSLPGFSPSLPGDVPFLPVLYWIDAKPSDGQYVPMHCMISSFTTIFLVHFH